MRTGPTDAALLLEMDRRSEHPMSRRDIADYLGLTVETVSRAMSRLRQQGILSFVGQTQKAIVLHDRLKLAEIVR
jgi:CRP/FNR family transcriptional regulator, nitrogen fixation regulation protein